MDRFNKSRVVVLCALAAMGGVGAWAAADGSATESAWSRNPWDRGGGGRGERPVPIEFPGYRDSARREFVIPSGRCYTGVVIVPTKSSGYSQRVRLIEGKHEFPIALQGGQTLTIPFAKGWHPGGRACIIGDLSEGDFEAWGISEDGPVAFECARR